MRVRFRPLRFLLIAAITPLTAQPLAAQQVASAPAPTAQPAVISAATRKAVLDTVINAVRRLYVDADTANRIADRLAERQRAGAFDTLTTSDRLSDAVTKELRAINGDLHLSLRFDPQLAPLSPWPPSAEALSSELTEGPATEPPTSRTRILGEPTPVEGVPPEMFNDPRYVEAKRRNFGLSKVEVLPGNIGYLEIRGFMGAPGAEHVIEDALRFLERTDALIVDLRRNGGGSGVMSHLIASHFLPKTPIETIRVKSRGNGSYTQTSFATVAGPRRTDVPLYILTSRRTGSAAEEFAFILRNAGRATIVGDRTAGAGHMVQSYNAGEGFLVWISVTRVSDVKTGLEWEGVGVQPHHPVPSESALEKAIALVSERKP